MRMSDYNDKRHLAETKTAITDEVFKGFADIRKNSRPSEERRTTGIAPENTESLHLLSRSDNFASDNRSHLESKNVSGSGEETAPIYDDFSGMKSMIGRTGPDRTRELEKEKRRFEQEVSGSGIGSTYIVQEVIGAGSGGVVYKAYHKRLKKLVVLKKMKIPHRNIEENRWEVDILKQLRHSYLPGVIDFINLSGEIYTVMDYIEGDSLQNLLRSGRVFSVEEAVKYTVELLEALVYLHRQEIPVIHGDIKPSNIMLTPSGDICLIDFNISGYLSDNLAAVSGYTAGYASPEQERAIREAIRSGHPVPPDMIDGRTDIYSTGAVLYVLLTGKRPGRNMDEIQLRLEHMKISDGLIHVLYRALQPEPSARYATASEMLGELRNYRKLESGYKKKVMSRRIAVGVAAAIVIAGILAVAELLRSSRTGKEKEYQSLLTSLESLADEIAQTEPGAGTDADNAGEVLNEKYAQAQELYTECSTMYPERCAPVVEMARFLYEAGEYDECRRFIRENVVMDRVNTMDELEQKDYGKLFYLLGNSCYQLEKMDEAIQSFSLAIEKDSTNPDYYRDYALALAKSGDRIGAEKVLRMAQENGLVSSQTAMVRGEILLAGNRYKEAIEAFAECIETTNSDTDRLRAYLNSARAYEQMGTGEENLRLEANLLEEAKTAVSPENEGPILETLAQTYIRLYDLTADASCAKKGVGIFREIIRNGWSTAMTYNNIIVLLQRTGNLVEARQYADEMMSKYPDDYRTYKRMAFVENAEQESRTQEERDYSNFVDYYQTAESLYGKNSDTGADDAEMRILEDAYQQLSAKGWL